MELNELLNQVQPDRPRQRVQMPIQQWISEYQNNGYIQVPVYMSVKATENPDGFKWNKVRKILASGHVNLSDEENALISKLFGEAFFTISRDQETKFRFALVVPSSQVSAMRKRNFLMKPVREGLSDAVKSPAVVIQETAKPPVSDKKGGKASKKAETPSSKNIPKSKKK